MEKAVTLLQAKRPHEPERLPIVTGNTGSTTQLIFEQVKPQTRDVHTLLGYISALRLIMGSYAYCGTHLTKSKIHPQTDVMFFDFGTCLGYADDCMHRTLEIRLPEPQKLQWLRTRDERTRKIMAQLINEDWPGSEALADAMRQTAHLWEMEDRTVAAPSDADEHPPRQRPPRRSPSVRRGAGGSNGKGGGKATKGGGSSLQGVRQATFDDNKRKICGTFNSKVGCTSREHQCPKKARHCCNFKHADGSTCEGRVGHKDHNIWNCPHVTGTFSG